MISWRHALKRLNEEYEIAKKKKQALDNLLCAGKISRQTYDPFDLEIGKAMADIEKQQKILLEKMNMKINELEGHIKTLEMLLANVEMQHAADEVDEETYQRETSVLSVGIEAARSELNSIKEAAEQISGGAEASEGSVTAKQGENVQLQETSKVYLDVVEVKPEEVESISPTAE